MAFDRYRRGNSMRERPTGDIIRSSILDDDEGILKMRLGTLTTSASLRFVLRLLWYYR